MRALLEKIGDNPLQWGLVFVPILFACRWLKPESHTLLFILSVLAVIPLAALLTLKRGSGRVADGDIRAGAVVFA